MTQAKSTFDFLRPKGGAWRIRRQWKVWGLLGSWFYLEISGRRFYLSIGRWYIESEVRSRG